MKHIIQKLRSALIAWCLPCICALIISSTIGCVSPKGKVVSQKDPSFDGRLQKVLIVCPDKQDSDLLGKQYSPRFLNHLTNALAQQRIPSSFVELENESLDNEPLIEKAAKKFRPTQLLHWRISGMNTFSTLSRTTPGDIPNYQSGTSVSIDFSVIDIWVNKAVWRARVSYQTSPAPEIVADQLLEELTKAKLLVEQSPQQNR